MIALNFRVNPRRIRVNPLREVKNMTALKRRGTFIDFLVIVMLLLAWPMGVILMWAYTPWSRSVKIAITVCLALLTILTVNSVCYFRIMPS